MTHHSGSSQVLLFQQCSMTSLLSHTAVLTLCSKRFPVIEKKLQNEKANKTTLGLHSLHCHFELTQGHFRSSFCIFSCQKFINELTFICHCIKMCFFLRQGHTLISEMLDCTYVFVCVCVCVFPLGPLSCSEGFTELGYYNGSVSQTDSGSSCLKWTDFPDYMLQYPDRGLADHNHCRNPDRESNPWCFFRQKSGAIGWAYCDCHQGEPSWLDFSHLEIFYKNLIFILLAFFVLLEWVQNEKSHLQNSRLSLQRV